MKKIILLLSVILLIAGCASKRYTKKAYKFEEAGQQKVLLKVLNINNGCENEIVRNGIITVFQKPETDIQPTENSFPLNSTVLFDNYGDNIKTLNWD